MTEARIVKAGGLSNYTDTKIGHHLDVPQALSDL